MADLNLTVNLRARQRGKGLRTVRDDLRAANGEARKFSKSTALVAGRWKDVSKFSGINKSLLRQQAREYDKIARSTRRLTLDEARRQEASRRHNREIRAQARLSLGGGAKRRGPGFDPDAPATNMSMAASAADRFGAAGQRALTSIATAGLEFETAVAEVTTLTDTISADEVAEVATRLSKEYGSLPTEQVAGFYSIVSNGATTAAEAEERLIAANRLALAGVSNQETAVLAISKAVENFGVTWDEAARSLFGAVQAGQVDLDVMADAMPNVAQAAGSMGLSIAETNGTIALLSKQMGNGLKASTGFQAALNNIEKGMIKGSKSRKEAKRMGIDFSKAGIQAAGGWEDFVRLIAANPKFNDQTLSKLFESTEARNAVKGLIKDVDKLAATTAAAGTDTDALDKGVKRMADTNAVKLKKMNAEWEEMKINLSHDLLPAIVDMAKVVAPLIKDLAKFAQQNPWIAKAALMSVAAAKIAGPLLHMGAGMAGLSGGRGFGMFAGQRAAAGAGAMGKASVGASNALAGTVGVGPSLLGAATAGYLLGQQLDELTGASDWLSTKFAEISNSAFFDKLNEPGATDVGTQGDILAKRRAQLDQVNQELSGRFGYGAEGMLGFGLVRQLSKAGGGTALEEEKARLESEITRRETGKTGAERFAEAGGARAAALGAAAALGIEIKVDQTGRVSGVNVTKKDPGLDVETEMDLGVR